MQSFVIGNAAIDEKIMVDRLPLAGESVFGRAVSDDLGGKGANQAVMLSRTGVHTSLIAAVGKDNRAEKIRQHLRNECLDARLQQIDDVPTDFSNVMTDTFGNNAIVTTVECARQQSFTEIAANLNDAQAGDYLILQGNLSIQITRKIIELAEQRKLKVVLNPSPVDKGVLDFLGYVNTLFLNEHEAKFLTGLDGLDAIKALLARGVNAAVLTLGEKGAILGTAQNYQVIPAIQCNVIDTTGAGDTFQSAALGSAILRNTTIDARALNIATKAAAITVSQQGTVSSFPTTDEMQNLLRG